MKKHIWKHLKRRRHGKPGVHCWDCIECGTRVEKVGSWEEYPTYRNLELRGIPRDCNETIAKKVTES